MTWRHLSVERSGPVERVTLSRPEVRNAFNDEMITELRHWAEAAARDVALRVAVLAGAGPSFCAGADVAWMKRMREYTEEENVADARAMSEMFGALNVLPVPLIGRLHGAALGGGTGLAAVCDIVVAAEDSVFGFTEVKLGILPAVISPFAIAKIGLSNARELMLTGMRFGAARAKEIGLVHRVVPSDGLDAAVDEYVREILSSSPSGIAAAKRLIPRVVGADAAEVRDLTSHAIAAQRVSAEGQEGLAAFLEKRPPWWVPRTG
jgi:methylglutaconyl-CoA hydratase